MGKVAVTHREQLGPNRVRTTYHFTRTDMCAAHAQGLRQTAKDLPSKQIDVYESEQVIIVERNLA